VLDTFIVNYVNTYCICIHTAMSLEYSLKLLDSVYLITSDRLEIRTFYSNESHLTLIYFLFVCDNTTNNRLSYISECHPQFHQSYSHVLVFEVQHHLCISV
jgi:hypothetical protein